MASSEYLMACRCSIACACAVAVGVEPLQLGLGAAAVESGAAAKVVARCSVHGARCSVIAPGSSTVATVTQFPCRSWPPARAIPPAGCALAARDTPTGTLSSISSRIHNISVHRSLGPHKLDTIFLWIYTTLQYYTITFTLFIECNNILLI